MKKVTSHIALISLFFQQIIPAFASNDSPEELKHLIEHYRSMQAPLHLKPSPEITAAGIIQYARDPDGQTVVLLGRRNDNQLWCNMGGKSDLKDQESFDSSLAETASRETMEETAEMYASSAPLIRDLPFTDVYIEAERVYYRMYWQEVQYILADHILAAVNGYDKHSIEYTEFRWTPIEILNATIEKFSSQDVEGHELHGGLYDSLSSDAGRQFLSVLHNTGKLNRFNPIVRKWRNRVQVVSETLDDLKPELFSNVKWVKNSRKQDVWIRKNCLDDNELSSVLYMAPMEMQEKDLSRTVAKHATMLVELKELFSRQHQADVAGYTYWTPTRHHLQLVLGKDYQEPVNQHSPGDVEGTDRENLRSYLTKHKEVEYNQKSKEAEFKRELNFSENDLGRLVEVMNWESRQAGCTLIHSANSGMNSLYKAFSEVRRALMLSPLTDKIILRGTDLYFRDVLSIQDANRKFGMHDYTHPMRGSAVLCANLILTAGLNTTRSTSSSIEYLLNDHSVQEQNLSKRFEEAMALAGIPSNFSPFHSLFQQFYQEHEGVGNSVLLAITLPRERLTQFTYHQKMDSYAKDNDQEDLPQLTQALDSLADKANEVRKTGEDFEANKESKRDIIHEARVLLHPALMLDANTKVRAFDRFSRSADQQTLHTLGMRQETAALLAEWLFNKQSSVQDSFTETPKLRYLHERIYRNVFGEDVIYSQPLASLKFLIEHNYAEALDVFLQNIKQPLRELLDINAIFRSLQNQYDGALDIIKVLDKHLGQPLHTVVSDSYLLSSCEEMATTVMTISYKAPPLGMLGYIIDSKKINRGQFLKLLKRISSEVEFLHIEGLKSLDPYFPGISKESLPNMLASFYSGRLDAHVFVTHEDEEEARQFLEACCDAALKITFFAGNTMGVHSPFYGPALLLPHSILNMPLIQVILERAQTFPANLEVKEFSSDLAKKIVSGGYGDLLLSQAQQFFLNGKKHPLSNIVRDIAQELPSFVFDPELLTYSRQPLDLIQGGSSNFFYLRRAASKCAKWQEEVKQVQSISEMKILLQRDPYPMGGGVILHTPDFYDLVLRLVTQEHTQRFFALHNFLPDHRYDNETRDKYSKKISELRTQQESSLTEIDAEYKPEYKRLNKSIASMDVVGKKFYEIQRRLEEIRREWSRKEVEINDRYNQEIVSAEKQCEAEIFQKSQLFYQFRQEVCDQRNDLIDFRCSLFNGENPFYPKLHNEWLEKLPLSDGVVKDLDAFRKWFESAPDDYAADTALFSVLRLFPNVSSQEWVGKHLRAMFSDSAELFLKQLKCIRLNSLNHLNGQLGYSLNATRLYDTLSVFGPGIIMHILKFIGKDNWSRLMGMDKDLLSYHNNSFDIPPILDQEVYNREYHEQYCQLFAFMGDDAPFRKIIGTMMPLKVAQSFIHKNLDRLKGHNRYGRPYIVTFLKNVYEYIDDIEEELIYANKDEKQAYKQFVYELLSQHPEFLDIQDKLTGETIVTTQNIYMSYQPDIIEIENNWLKKTIDKVMAKRKK
ncbi:MAG: hypothetical protein KBB83_04860 [Alphaproteobacteria bacterium]|nr:hypothetical protein [Alphaproteobacteria bacterium]